MDRRENVRFTLQPEQRRAKLKVGGKKFAAEIIEQSSAGFRVQVASDAKVALDDVVTLEAWSGTCRAVVAYVEDVNKTRRLGLKRISDDMPTRMNLLRTFWRERQPGKRAKKGSGRPRLVAAGCFGLAVLLAGWFTLRLYNDLSAVDRPAARSLAKDEAADEPSREMAAAEDANSGDKVRQSSAQPATQPRTASEPMAVLQRLLALQSTETANELDLSEKQKLEISRLMDETSLGLNRLQSRRAAKSSTERKEKIRTLFSRAEARALKILTPQQQTKWLGELSPRQQTEVRTTAMANTATEH
jgi:hypothetical protein